MDYQYTIPWDSEFYAILLVFVRVGSALMTVPGIGDAFVSTRVRLLLACACAYLLGPLAKPYIGPIPEEWSLIASTIMIEVLHGIIAGNVVRLFFAALETAGTILGIQQGIGQAVAFNPVMATSTPLFGAYLNQVALVLFFTSDLYAFFLKGVFHSFKLYGPGHFYRETWVQLIVEYCTSAFSLAFYICAPILILGAVFFVALGLINRAMPQMQVFFIIQPLQLLLGLLILIITLQSMLNLFGQTLLQVLQKLWGVI